ncbi:MAG: energy-coupling factor ABC transporter permease [Bryobacteraceae bacterium]
MHIPDGFLSTPVWAAFDVCAVPCVVYASRKAQQEFEESRLPLLGVMGAFVFAAQMINFPVGAGTSGHLVGGALLAMTLGPAAASVVMTAILAIQALIFQDGGILALGANVFNMAIAGVLAGYLPFRLWGAGKARKAAVFAGGTLSILVSALLAIAQLLLSGVKMPGAILGISLGLFVVSAALEGAITLAVFQTLERIRPSSIAPAETRRVPALLGIAAVVLAVFGVLIASGAPDGLESLAEKAGFAAQARALVSTPLADYEAGFLHSEWGRKAVAGLAGLAAIYAVCAGLARYLSAQRSQ